MVDRTIMCGTNAKDGRVFQTNEQSLLFPPLEINYKVQSITKQT